MFPERLGWRSFITVYRPWWTIQGRSHRRQTYFG